jgi:hypothetical protein
MFNFTRDRVMTNHNFSLFPESFVPDLVSALFSSFTYEPLSKVNHSYPGYKYQLYTAVLSVGYSIVARSILHKS